MKRILPLAVAVPLLVGAGWEGDDGGLDHEEVAANVSAYAERGQQIQLTTPPPPPTTTNPPILGPLGKPIAPYWLDGCAEFRWYADQFGLPGFFDGIAWRESNCRNEDGVRTSCCHGYLQLNADLHIRGGMADEYAACGVYSHYDINSDTPADKQRHLCAAAALYRSQGTSPWSATR